MAFIVAVLVDGILDLKLVPVAMIAAVLYCLDYVVIFALYEIGVDTFLSNTIYGALFWGAVAGFSFFWYRDSLLEDDE